MFILIREREKSRSMALTWNNLFFPSPDCWTKRIQDALLRDVINFIKRSTSIKRSPETGLILKNWVYGRTTTTEIITTRCDCSIVWQVDMQWNYLHCVIALENDGAAALIRRRFIDRESENDQQTNVVSLELLLRFLPASMKFDLFLSSRERLAQQASVKKNCLHRIAHCYVNNSWAGLMEEYDEAKGGQASVVIVRVEQLTSHRVMFIEKGY